MEVKLKNVRLAFAADLFTAKKSDDGYEAFGCGLLLPKDHPQIKDLREAEETVGKEKFGAKWPQVKKDLVANNKLALKDGDTKSWDGYEGHWYLSPRSKTRPTVIDRDRSPLVEKDGKPYSGSYVNAIVDIWAMDSSDYGKRISCGLKGVQFLRDGDAFGGNQPAKPDEFDDLSDMGEDETALA